MESPGTAPGSDPLIASAFISIVPKYKTEHSRVLCQMQTIDASSQVFREDSGGHAKGGCAVAFGCVV